MIYKAAAMLAFLALPGALGAKNDSRRQAPVEQENQSRQLKASKASSSSSSSSSSSDARSRLRIRVTNLTFAQPFSPMFYMVHDADVDPLFIVGQSSSEALQVLAENGDPSELVAMYEDMDGVQSVGMVDTPTAPGATARFNVRTAGDELVTIASMFVNSNDGFVALNGVQLESGMVIRGVGYDSGTEENNQLCSSIPGPACAEGSGNAASGNGEGFVHIHRGMQTGVGDIDTADTAWLNPMIQISVR